MPVLTSDQIKTLDYSGDGGPWCRIATKSYIDTKSLDWSADGSPWLGSPDPNSTRLAKEFTGLEDALGQTAILYDEQGTSWGATNKYQEVLFCWIATIGGDDVLIGRIDGRGHDHDTKVPAKTLSDSTSIEGVRCCYNPYTDGWVVVYNIGTSLYYKLFDRDLVETKADTLLPTAMSAGYSVADYNLGCDDSGYFSICWLGWFIRYDSTNTLKQNLHVNGGSRMHVHVESGHIDLTRISDEVLTVDRFDENFGFLYSVGAATSATLTDKLHAITNRYGNDGFIIVYLDETSGDNINYRAFSEAGDPLYATKTITGTGHIDTTSNKGRLHVHIGERACVDDQYHTFGIRAVSTDSSSNRVVALIEPQNFNPAIIDKEEYVNISDANARFGQPIVLPSQFETRSLKTNSDQTSMSLEVYVRQSVWMNLWRIEDSARVFYNSIYDDDSRVLVENVYTTYPDGSRLAGSTCSTDACYVAAPGRSGVDPDTTDFVNYWGTSTSEDNVFIGGPKLNEISYSFENNPNMFDSQIATLSSVMGFSGLEYYFIDRPLGWGLGIDSPEIRVTINGVQYIMRRHELDVELWYQSSNAENIVMDYGIIVRLPLTSSSTQADRSHIYIAGINACGTEAASYVFKNALAYKLGSSCAHLVVMEHDYEIGRSIPYSNYISGATGNIRAYPLSIAVANNFEGIR